MAVLLVLPPYLLEEAITSRQHYSEIWHLHPIKAAWVHFLLASIAQNDQTDNVLPFDGAGHKH